MGVFFCGLTAKSLRTRVCLGFQNSMGLGLRVEDLGFRAEDFGFRLHRNLWGRGFRV